MGRGKSRFWVRRSIYRKRSTFWTRPSRFPQQNTRSTNHSTTVNCFWKHWKMKRVCTSLPPNWKPKWKPTTSVAGYSRTQILPTSCPATMKTRTSRTPRLQLSRACRPQAIRTCQLWAWIVLGRVILWARGCCRGRRIDIIRWDCSRLGELYVDRNREISMRINGCTPRSRWISCLGECDWREGGLKVFACLNIEYSFENWEAINH